MRATAQDLFHTALEALGWPQSVSWNTGNLRDEWFRSHFEYAADVVAEWVGAERLKKAHVLDFGCGDGITMLGLMLRHGLPAATGVDVSATHKGLKKLAAREIGLRRLPANLRFQRIVPGQRFEAAQPVDVLVSWSTFEHVAVPYLGGILDNLREVLADDGVFFLQINPLFYSPQGSHLGRFQLPPWAHLLWDEPTLEQAVMDFAGQIPADEVEENFHKRDFAGYKDFVLREYRELNRLTAAELVTHVKAHGFEVVREAYGKVDLPPPAELLHQHAADDLLIEEVRLLLRKR